MHHWRIANGSSEAIHPGGVEPLQQLRVSPAEAVPLALALIEPGQSERGIPVDGGELPVGFATTKVLRPAAEGLDSFTP
jgi:hypothetical protein